MSTEKPLIFEHEEYYPINVPELEQKWLISKSGKIYSKHFGRLLKQQKVNGYFMSGGYMVHRLVLLTFVGPSPELEKINVNHIDENRENNNLENLEWVTQLENVRKCTKDMSHTERVSMLDKDGNVVETFESIDEAAKKYGISRHAIGKVCNGKHKTCLGSKWVFAPKVGQQEEKKDDVDPFSEGIPIDGYPGYLCLPEGKIFSTKTKGGKFLKLFGPFGKQQYQLIGPNKKKQNMYPVKLSKLYAEAKNNGYKTITYSNGKEAPGTKSSEKPDDGSG
jgi:hypothetical protein